MQMHDIRTKTSRGRADIGGETRERPAGHHYLAEPLAEVMLSQMLMPHARDEHVGVFIFGESHVLSHRGNDAATKCLGYVQHDRFWRPMS